MTLPTHLVLRAMLATVGLEQSPIAAWVTGKFVLESREDADRAGP